MTSVSVGFENQQQPWVAYAPSAETWLVYWEEWERAETHKGDLHARFVEVDGSYPSNHLHAPIRVPGNSIAPSIARSATNSSPSRRTVDNIDSAV